MRSLLITIRIVLLISFVLCVTSFPYFQSQIPNGDRVPVPCKPDTMWFGVGHFLIRGSAYRNVFGTDFANAGNQWIEALCRKDTDEDGMSNGEELGDPDCVWTPGDTPSRLTGISHPGICDPWNSTYCLQKPVNHPIFNTQEDWMSDVCRNDNFDCAAIHDEGVQNMTVRFQPTTVPTERYTLMCQTFTLPEGETRDFQLIAMQPIIDNADVVNHILLFGCEDDQEMIPGPYKCPLYGTDKCRDMIAGWQVGLPGVCANNATGYRLGLNGYKMFVLQLDWRNPEGLLGLTDSSGMTLYITDKLRPYDSGLFTLGSGYFDLPPNRTSVKVVSICTGTCTQKYFAGPVYVTEAADVMRSKGISMSIEVRRNNAHVTYLTNEPIYVPDRPHLFLFDEPVQLLPGDELVQTCEYSTQSVSKTVLSGQDTTEEQCYGFLTIYPKQNVLSRSCLDEAGFSYCDSSTYQGCDTLFDYADEQFLSSTRFYQDVTANCQLFGPCTEECLTEMVYHMRTNPCLQGDVWEFIRSRLLPSNELGLALLLRIYSCSAEAALQLAS